MRIRLSLLFFVVAIRLMLHLATGSEYGFHRDELATIDDARYLAAGYVAYPPITPLIGRAALELFGPSLSGIRLFAALAQALSMLLVGLMARQLGASPAGQAIAAVAAGIAPVAMMAGVLFQYVAFDHLWWVLAAYFVTRRIRSADPRWWIAIGAAIGLGMMTKYTMGFLVLGIVAGVFFTPLRRDLRSPWLWGGVVVSLLIFAPNLAWQIRNGFVSLDFLAAIHERDVRIGRADGFVMQQFFIATNLVTVPLWIAGLWHLFVSREGKAHRALGWMFVVPFVLFLVMQGRAYYMTPAYGFLFAAGAVAWDRWAGALRPRTAAAVRWATALVLAIGFVLSAVLSLPIGAVNGTLWNARANVHREFHEEIGWEELVQSVAEVYRALPERERSRTGILAGNYGEAGAVNLYRARYGLPEAISGVNSYWARGWGDPPPEHLILLGSELEEAQPHFEECSVAGRVTNRHGVENEESRDHPDILYCRGLKPDWKDVWPQVRGFG